MDEQNPYQSPEFSNEQPHPSKRFGWRHQFLVFFWICWIIGLLVGLLLALG